MSTSESIEEAWAFAHHWWQPAKPPAIGCPQVGLGPGGEAPRAAAGPHPSAPERLKPAKGRPQATSAWHAKFPVQIRPKPAATTPRCSAGSIEPSPSTTPRTAFCVLRIQRPRAANRDLVTVVGSCAEDQRQANG